MLNFKVHLAIVTIFSSYDMSRFKVYIRHNKLKVVYPRGILDQRK